VSSACSCGVSIATRDSNGTNVAQPVCEISAASPADPRLLGLPTRINGNDASDTRLFLSSVSSAPDSVVPLFLYAGYSLVISISKSDDYYFCARSKHDALLFVVCIFYTRARACAHAHTCTYINVCVNTYTTYKRSRGLFSLSYPCRRPQRLSFPFHRASLAPPPSR